MFYKKICIAIFIFFGANIPVWAKVINLQSLDTVNTKVGQLSIKDSNDGHGQQLYLEATPLDIHDQYLGITPIELMNSDSEIFLIDQSAGGSRTIPCYSIISIDKSKLIQTDLLGCGIIDRIVSDGRSITAYFMDLVGFIDGGLVEPAYSITYEDGQLHKIDSWFMIRYGSCLPVNIKEFLEFFSDAGIQVHTNDIEEEGIVVETSVIVRHETLQFYRGNKRCEKVIQKRNDDLDRYD